MMANKAQQVFWEVIEVLRNTGILPHVMVIGSWAEYLYTLHFGTDYLPSLKTRDIDILYSNYYYEVDGAEHLVKNFRSAGFIFDEHFENTGKILKDGLEIEFLTSQMGSGPGLVEIPFTGIHAEKLSNMGMLKSVWVQTNGYDIRVPSPPSYVAHKLYINPTRQPLPKRAKDIEAVRSLLLYISSKPKELEALRTFVENLSDEQKTVISSVAVSNGLDVPGLKA